MLGGEDIILPECPQNVSFERPASIHKHLQQQILEVDPGFEYVP